ncbi:MAG: diguanylate cyclase [Lachnospiraceae bacterium]
MESIEERKVEEANREDRIQQLEKQLNSLEKSIPGGVCEVCADEEWTILWHNKNYLEIIGYTEEQFKDELQSKAVGYVVPEDVERINKLMQETVAKGQRYFTTEMRIARRNGEERILMTSFSFIPNEEGTIPTSFSVGIDITEYKYNKELQQNAEIYLLAMAQTSNCVWEYDIATKCMSSSESLFNIFGLKGNIENVPESLIEQGLIHPDYVQETRRMYQDLERGVANAHALIQARKINGEYIWLDIKQTLIFGEDGKPKKAIALAEDVTQRHNIEIRYQEAEKRREAMMYDFTFVCQLNMTGNTILHVNEKDFPLYGLKLDETVSELLHKITDHFIHPEQRGQFLKSFSQESVLDAFKRGIQEVEIDYQCLTQDHTYRWHKSIMNIIREPVKGDLYAYIYMKDIQEQKLQELALLRQAQRDSLTDLYNRHTLKQKTNDMLQYVKYHDKIQAMYMIDLDNFKSVNDKYGHTKGDEILIQTAKALRSVIRDQGIVGRMGGDEFYAFVPTCVSIPRVKIIADNICKALKCALSETCIVAASVGVAIAPRDGDDFNTLYRCADEALYQAKRNGKDGYVVYSAKLRRKQASLDSVSVSREWLLDESNDLVYVSDMENYNLLYMNKGAKEAFGIDPEADLKGRKCYEVLQHLQEPCEFCNNHLLCRESFYTWEHQNLAIQRFFQIKDRIVDWYGRPARIEMATDLTKKENEKNELEKQVRMNQVLLQCLHKMNVNVAGPQLIDDILGEVGTYYQADRAYIVWQKSAEKRVIYEWTKKGITPLGQLLYEIPSLDDNFFTRLCGDRDDYRIDSQKEAEKKYPDMYRIMRQHAIESQRAIPFRQNGIIGGMIALDNPHISQDDLTLLRLLEEFLIKRL